MSLREDLEAVLRAPSAANLWTLRAGLLEAGLPAGSDVWEVLGEFEHFLDEVATRTSSWEYSQLSSRLDIAAVGGVVIEQVLEAKGQEDVGLRALSGLLSEGLMILATRQHVKAWEGELAAVYRRAGWYLYAALWRWTEARTPGLPPGERRRLLDELFAPVRSPDTVGFSKALLLGLLFQVLLASHASRDLPEIRTR
jgi:hypothetical protein